MQPAAVIFDCDGTLVDSEQAWSRAETELYARRGIEFTKDHKLDLIGTSGPIALATVERHLGLPPGEGHTITREMHELALAEIQRGAPPMPGASELIAALRRQSVPLGLATNSTVELLHHSLAGAGFADAFAALVSAEEVPHGKPAPDVYLECARRLGVDAADCVALEDSPAGVAAAHAAGMFVVGIPSMTGIDLGRADLVVASLHAPEVHAAVGLRLAA